MQRLQEVLLVFLQMEACVRVCVFVCVSACVCVLGANQEEDESAVSLAPIWCSGTDVVWVLRQHCIQTFAVLSQTDCSEHPPQNRFSCPPDVALRPNPCGDCSQSAGTSEPRTCVVFGIARAFASQLRYGSAEDGLSELLQRAASCNNELFVYTHTY